MKFWISLMLLTFSLPTWAERLFDIEVVVFKRNVSPETTQEAWPDDISAVDTSKAGLLSSDEYRESKGVTLLSGDQFQLNTAVSELKRHAGFQVLLHTAWRQNDAGKRSAPRFHLQAGNDFAALFNEDGSPFQTIEPSPVEGVSEMSIPNPVYELDGTVQVYVEHYLYANIDLDLREPYSREVPVIQPQTDTLAQDNSSVDPFTVNTASSDAGDVKAGNLAAIEAPQTQIETVLKRYRLEQKRRMRSGETHYFDHPLLGIILQVRKVEEGSDSASSAQ